MSDAEAQPGESSGTREAAFAPSWLAREMAATADEAASVDLDSEAARRAIAECASLLSRYWPGDTPAVDASVAASRTEPPSASASENGTPHAAGEQLGRFEIRRRLGHGGFGIVFLVFDPRLGREAALKIPRPEILVVPHLARRFLREAQAAAVLDHPGIIPIFETGEIGPVSYILSGYCKGPTLAGWLSERNGPVPARLAARIAVQLADAVAHAHDRGVLHRDLKPSNVLLEPVEGEGDECPFQPRLSDFGLAKRLTDAADETRTGAVLGTPRYMAPEQARGDERAIGVQTDVYALGAILYELLSGQPPLAGDSDSLTLRWIAEREPSPAPLRSQAVPIDLVTVCLKCLEKEPARRYPSARDLADDLRRFLSGEAVSARPIGAIERVARWCRRRPLIASLAAALLAAVLVGAAAATSQWVRAERHLAAAEASAAEARQNLERAERALLDLSWIVEESSLWSKETVSLGGAIDARLKQYYDALARSPAAAVESKPIRAAIHSYTARSGAHAGADRQQVDRQFRRAVELWHEVVAEHSESREYRRASALCLYSYAMFLREGRRGTDAPLADVASLFHSTAQQDPASARALADLATLLRERAHVHVNARAEEEALAALEIARLAADELVARFPEDRDAALLAATLARLHANALRRTGDRAGAVAGVKRAHELLEPFTAAAANDFAFIEEAAEVYRMLGYQLRGEGENREAAEWLARSVALHERLVARQRGQGPLLRMALAVGNLASVQENLEQKPEAFETLIRYREIFRRAQAMGPVPDADLRAFARNCLNLGMRANLLERSDVARAAFADGAAAFDEAASHLDLGPLGVLSQAECHAFLAAHLVVAGETDAAIEHYDTTRKLLERKAKTPNADVRLTDRYRKAIAALESLRAAPAEPQETP